MKNDETLNTTNGRLHIGCRKDHPIFNSTSEPCPARPRLVGGPPKLGGFWGGDQACQAPSDQNVNGVAGHPTALLNWGLPSPMSTQISRAPLIAQGNLEVAGRDQL